MDEVCQLLVQAGSFLGHARKKFVFRTLSWLSHKAKRQVRSVSATKYLAAV